MSEIKVNSIKGAAASTAAITVNNTDGTCTANITNNLSNRNLVINGAMQVAQRGTSNTTNGYGTVDRIYMGYANVDEAPTQAQVDVASGETPYTLGFRKAFKITNGNQSSGAGADDYIYFNAQAIEAQNLANSGWNFKSSSSNVTLSFWVKSSVAQNFYFQFDVRDGTRYSYAMETGSLTADTWTKVTKTIPGNSNLTIDNDNGVGAYLTFGLFWGTNLTGSVSLNTWGVASDSAKTPDYTSTWYTTNDATFEITGVQLEVGSVATDFEHRSFAQELVLCQRYFVKYNQGFNTGARSGAGGSTIRYNYQLPVPLRAQPTISAPSGGSYSCKAYLTDGTSTSTNTPAVASGGYGWTANQPYIYAEQAGHSSTDDRVASIEASNTIELSSEL